MKLVELSFSQFLSIISENTDGGVTDPQLAQLQAQLAALDQRISTTITPLQRQRQTLLQQIATRSKTASRQPAPQPTIQQNRSQQQQSAPFGSP